MIPFHIRYGWFIPPFMLIFFLAGCWSRIELNDRAFVKAIFVDKGKKDGIELTILFPLPNRLPAQIGGSPIGIPYATVSANGQNMAEAYRYIQSDLPRQINWGHTKVIVVGRELAEEGIRPILEFVNRHPSFRIKTFMMVAPGPAKEITELSPVFERFPDEILREFSAQQTMLNSTVRDFLMADMNGGDMVAGMLTLKPKKLISEAGKKKPWVGTDGAALFKNGKMVAALNVKEMRGSLWILNRMKNAVVTIPSPKDQKPISFFTYRTKTSIKPIFKGNQISFRIQTTAEGNLISSDSSLDISDPKQVQKLENLFASEIKSYMQQAFQKSRQKGADGFQLGSYIEWHYPKKWKETKPHWRKTYQEKVKVDIQVQASIKQPGAETNPVWVKEKP